MEDELYYEDDPDELWDEEEMFYGEDAEAERERKFHIEQLS